MTSNISNKHQQLMNEIEDDPYKSVGHIELRIENLTGFAQEKTYSRRYSETISVYGVKWRILAILCGHDQPAAAQNGQKSKCFGYVLHCYGSIDPSWSCSANGQLKILAQKKEEGVADHVHKISQTFNAKQNSWEFAQHITFEELMNPDRDWYDAQSDSITLAADFTVDAAGGRLVGKYVLVAQNELTLDKAPTHFSMQVGNLQWQIDYDFDDQIGKDEKSVVFSCKDMAKASMEVDKVMLKLHCYHRDDPKSEAYSPIPEKSVQYHLFTRKDNSLTVKVPAGCAYDNLLFTVRVYKQYSQLPDFTKEPTAMVGRNTTNVALRVGDQQFHVNKQLLAAHSLFFDRMFHGDYTAATQQEVELSLNTHSPELFHHFLLVMCVAEVLPNSMNVGTFFKLADFYDAENVQKKCDQHLRMAREMSIEKRVLLARDHGSKETRALIMDSVNLEQAKRIGYLFMENRSL